MHSTKTKAQKFRSVAKWVLWVLFVQVILINISAAFYAHKLSHFYDQPKTIVASQNVFSRTWKLFVGPRFFKNTSEPGPAFNYKEVVLKTADNIDISAWYSAVDSLRTCVIFFHGITANKSFMSKEASVFRKWGYNVMLVDFRAHGMSGGNNSSFGVKETEEVKLAYDYAMANGNQNVILYGLSLGAGVCIKAVSEKKVSPLAIIADMPFGSLRQHLRSRARNLGFPSEPFATLVTMWMGVQRGFNGFKHEVPSYAKNVHCPVLVQWGEEDSYVSREEVNSVFENLASPNKKLVVYPGADHESLVGVDPIAWQNQVHSFIKTLE